MISTNIIRSNKKYIKPANYFSRGKFVLCYGTRIMCSKRVNTTATFASNQTNKIFDIYRSLKCKSKYIICLLECSICTIQYAGKSETPYHIRLNNHRKDIRTQLQYQYANISTHSTMISILTEINNNRTIERHNFIVHRNSLIKDLN